MDLGVGILDIPDAPFCSECRDADRGDIEMVATEGWHGQLAGYVSVWECPECQHQVIRDANVDGPELITPDGERL